MPTFDIRLFGAIEIRRDGVLLTDFRSQKALVLLAYLICANRPITRDYLAGLAWPEMEQSQALGLLRRSLHDLNSQLPGCLEMDRRTVCFSPTASATVDIQQFANILALNDLDSWAAAATFYRAPFLHGIYVDAAPELENWLLRQQEQWQQAVTRVLQRLIQHHTDEAAYALALRYVQQLLALEPWREEVQRQAMLLLTRTGQVSAALAQYERCRQVLRAELDVEPAEETKSLRTRIASMGHIPAHSLPPATTPLVGRTTELAELTQLLADRHCRLITLVGPGGMGKTRLAIETARGVASDQHPCFLHGVVFVALIGVDTLAQFVSALAQALAFTFQTRSAPETQLLHYLRDKDLLLVLDNFEQMINAPILAFVRQLLDTGPESKLLITSRVRLHLQSEQLYWLQGLHVPVTTTATTKPGVAETATYSSVQLFLATVWRSRPHYTLSTDDASAVMTICQLVQGVPLAIELAAAWMSVLGPPQIVTEIRHNLDFLASDLHDLPLRQRSMRAVFATSWRLLTQTEQAMFQQLSVFRGNFTREAAQAVTGTSLAGLMGLIHKSFLQWMPDKRYQIHELLRQFAEEKLADSPSRQVEAQVRHSDYYLTFVTQRAPRLMGSQQPMLLNEIGQEIDNIRAGWLWAAGHGKGDSLNNALDGLYEYYQNRSQWSEGVEVFIQTCEMLQRTSTDGATSRIFGRIQARQGAFAYKLGRYEQGCLLLQTSLALARQLDDKPEIAFCLNFMGIITWWQGGELAALPLLEESLALSRMLGDLVGIATALHTLTFVVHTASEYRQAKPFAEESLAVSRQLGHTHHIAENLDKLGAIAFGLGEYIVAIEYYQQALAAFRQLNHRAAMAIALTGLARGRYGAGERRHASLLPLLEEAVACSREVGDFFSLFVAVGVMGQIAGWLGDYTTCERCAQELVDQLQDAQHPFRSSCLGLLGEAKRGLGQLDLARHHLHAALVATLKTQTKLVTTGQTVLLSWARLLWAESLLPNVVNLPSHRAEQQAQALEIATVLLHEPKVWPIWKDHTRSFVAEVEAQLPPEVATAAKNRGRTKTLTQIATAIVDQPQEAIL